MDFDDVSTGSTWSWLPAACAAALATLDVFDREPVLENVRALETAGLEGLRELMATVPGRSATCAPSGCFMAVEFVKDRVDEGAGPRAAGARVANGLRRSEVCWSTRPRRR